MSPSTLCTRCGKPRQTATSASITQWLSVCRCDFIDLPETGGSDTDVCPDCKKRVNAGRSGSFTQMIFRSDLCSCNRPSGENGDNGFAGSSARGPAFVGYTEEDIEDCEPPDLDPEFFPLDRYQPLKELGSGSGGSVYLCKDLLLGKRVAVKVLHVLSAEQLVAFQDEARATSRLNHENIISIIDFGSTPGGSPYMVLEFFPGQTLRAYLDQNGPMEPELAQEVFLELLAALDYSHRHGIYHRDLKPSNIMLRGKDVRVIDFGVAKVSEMTGQTTEFQGRTMAGTPYYMSPDVINGFDYTAASEIYSVGCMLFETLTGQVPFQGDTALSTLNLHASCEPPSLWQVSDREFPEQLETFVATAMAKSPADRFPGAEEAAEFLRQPIQSVNSDESISAETDLPEYSSGEGRPTFLYLALSVCLLASIGGWLLFLFLSSSESLAVSDMHIKDIPIRSVIAPISDEMREPRKKIWSDRMELTGDWTDSTYSKIKVGPEIKELRILNPSMEFGKGLTFLDDSNIETLDTRTTGITEDAIPHIVAMKHLRYLRIDACPNITDEGIKMLARCPCLEKLNLRDTRITDQSIEYISELSSLREINLSTCMNLKGIGRLKQIKSLYASDLDLTGKLDGFEKLYGLRSLTLPRCGLTSRDVRHLLPLTITDLNVSGNLLSEQAILSLSKIRGLRIFTVAGDMDLATRLNPIMEKRGISFRVESSRL
ncbi:MAG: protein kinase [Cyanobacteria bacterium HKST-UBA02]|nr:protein kinase [Cyanobacteria bacterium HKST-UBA02]